jgi:hypothetical protein
MKGELTGANASGTRQLELAQTTSCDFFCSRDTNRTHRVI